MNKGSVFTVRARERMTPCLSEANLLPDYANPASGQKKNRSIDAPALFF